MHTPHPATPSTVVAHTLRRELPLSPDTPPLFTRRRGDAVASSPAAPPQSLYEPNARINRHEESSASSATPGALEESVVALRRRAYDIASVPTTTPQERFGAQRDVAVRQALVYVSNPTESNFALAEKAARSAHRLLHHLVDVISESGLDTTLPPHDQLAMTVSGLHMQAMLIALHANHGTCPDAVKLAFAIFAQLPSPDREISRPTAVASAAEIGMGPHADPASVVLQFPGMHEGGLLSPAETNAWLELVLLVESVDCGVAEIFFRRLLAIAPHGFSRVLLHHARDGRTQGVLLSSTLLPGVGSFATAFLAGSSRVTACVHSA